MDDEGLSEANVGEVQVLREATMRRGESTIHVESKTHFDSRRSSSPNARQRCHIAAHSREGSQPHSGVGSYVAVGETAKETVWRGCIKELARVELIKSNEQLGPPGLGELNSGKCWKAAAVVEWESSVKLDPITSLSFSTRRRGRV